MAKKEEKKQGISIDISVLRRLLSFAMPQRKTFYTLIFLTIVIALLGPVQPYLIQYTVDHYMTSGQENWLLKMMLIMVAILTFQAVLKYIHTYMAGWLGQTIIKDLRTRLYKHLLGLRLKFYDNTPIGQLITRNISDIDTLSNVFSHGLAAMVADILQLVAILLVMFWTDWKLTLVSLSTLPILLLTTYVFKEKIKTAFSQVRNAVSSLNTFVQEHITGINIVQIFAREEAEQQKFDAINNRHKKANLKAVLYYSVYFPIAEIISAAGMGLLVWYGAQGVISEDVTLGKLIAFIMYIGLFFRPIRLIADRFNTLQMGLVSTERIIKLLDNNEHVPNEGTYAPDSIKGDVSFEKVYFAYKDDDYVLKDISFEVKKGETVALVGATGAGKSSIINLLNRFYEISDGGIKVDNVDIYDYRISNLRSHIGLVMQDVFLFSGSIRDNITLGNTSISDDQIWNAAELVGAKGFIQKLDNRLDYLVMERGSTLSVGQRQLISFVRTMVFDPTILILDEATSSVDSETEEMIQDALLTLMDSRTSIVIAHRLSTIIKADKIIVLDKGCVMEMGSHDELLLKEGYYHKLYQMQYQFE